MWKNKEAGERCEAILSRWQRRPDAAEKQWSRKCPAQITSGAWLQWSVLIWVSSELVLQGSAAPSVVLMVGGLICADTKRSENVFMCAKIKCSFQKNVTYPFRGTVMPRIQGSHFIASVISQSMMCKKSCFYGREFLHCRYWTHLVSQTVWLPSCLVFCWCSSKLAWSQPSVAAVCVFLAVE